MPVNVDGKYVVGTVLPRTRKTIEEQAKELACLLNVAIDNELDVQLHKNGDVQKKFKIMLPETTYVRYDIVELAMNIVIAAYEDVGWLDVDIFPVTMKSFREDNTGHCIHMRRQ